MDLLYREFVILKNLKIVFFSKILNSRLCLYLTLFMIVPVPNYWNWTKITPQKKPVFLVKRFDNFSHRNARVTKLWSHDHTYNIIWFTLYNFVSDLIDKTYDMITFDWKCFYFKRPRVSIFAHIIKIVTIVTQF